MANTLAGIVDEFSRQYKLSSKVIQAEIITAIKSGQSASKAVNQVFAAHGVAKNMVDQVLNAQVQAVGLATGKSLTVDKVITQALNKPWASDDMKLSARIHNATEDMRNIVVDTISYNQKLGREAILTARALYDGYGYGGLIKKQALPEYLNNLQTTARRLSLGEREQEELMRQIRNAKRLTENLGLDGAPNQALKTAYKGIIDAVSSADEKSLVKAVEVAMEEKSRYIAERIARTEAGRAYFDGIIAKNQNDHDVKGYRWHLGSRHPDMDICDMYAQADLYGLGPGVYPKNKVPQIPAHPHCLCRLAPVYEIETRNQAEVNRVQIGGKEWLESLSPEKRKALLGIPGAKVFNETGSWKKSAKLWSEPEEPTSRIPAKLLKKAEKEEA